MAYFYSILSQVSKEHYNKNPLMSVRRYEELAFVTLEFRRRADAEICLNLDGTDFSNSCPVPMRIMRVRRFVDQWNDAIDKGRNPTLASRGVNTGGFDTMENDEVMGAR
jgi:hypothetical protein